MPSTLYSSPSHTHIATANQERDLISPNFQFRSLNLLFPPLNSYIVVCKARALVLFEASKKVHQRIWRFWCYINPPLSLFTRRFLRAEELRSPPERFWELLVRSLRFYLLSTVPVTFWW